jgi:hypothetical protein
VSDDAALPERGRRGQLRGERRWPMALAVVTVGALHASLPADFKVFPGPVFQLILAVLLVALTIGDPGRIDRDTPAMRILTDALIGLITLVTFGGVLRLVHGILTNAKFTDAEQLLRIGAVLWVVNVIAFALWFWDLDSGGPASRASGKPRTTRAFVFPEMHLPENEGTGWFPHFADYLTMSFYTATAFSPTDVSAVKRWAKLLMVLESTTSLLIGLLVFARAINIWPTPS